MTASDLLAFLRETTQAAHAQTGSLHAGLAQALRAAVRDRMVTPGTALPGERDLAQRLDLSRVTVRRAIETLVDERVLVRRHGMRTSVAPGVEKPLAHLYGFSEDMRARGFVPAAIWIDRGTGGATDSEAEALDVPPGEPVCRMVRLRTADGMPMALERAVVPCAFLPSPDLVSDSLYAVLARHGFMPKHARQRLRADSAGADEARHLDLAIGAPLLVIERHCSLQDGRKVEYTQSRYRADRYDFIIDITRPD